MNDIFDLIKQKWHTLADDDKMYVITAFFPAAFCLILLWFGIESNTVDNLLMNFSEVFLICFTILCVYFIYRLIRRNKIKTKVFYIVFVVYFILSVPYIPKLLGYKTMQIGDFYEAEEYKAKYYVIMSRDPDGSAIRKEYKLPAEIERRTDYLYHINYIFFSNGGYLNFTDRDDEDTVLSPDKETRCIDNKNEYYYITLTKEKCK